MIVRVSCYAALAMAVIAYLLTFALAVFGVMFAPSRVACPRAWSLCEGVQRDGRFACCAPLRPIGCEDGSKSTMLCEPQAKARADIWCTNGTRPIVVDDRTVGCQRGYTEASR